MQRLRRLRDKFSDRLVLGVLVLIGVLAIGFSIAARIAGGQDRNWWGWADSLAQNFGAGMIGALVTFLLIDRIIGGRELKARLIREMGSNVQNVAVQAVNELRAHGWLTDGSLNGRYLLEANLEGAYLEYANLQKTKLSQANLQKADLRHANLRRASLLLANLQGANLRNADLWKAGLAHVILKGANLEGANLQEADFANLSRADFLFDEKTVLPDKTHWTPGANLSHFTNPDHPKFWRSDDPHSPAYRGHESQLQEMPGPDK